MQQQQPQQYDEAAMDPALAGLGTGMAHDGSSSNGNSNNGQMMLHNNIPVDDGSAPVASTSGSGAVNAQASSSSRMPPRSTSMQSGSASASASTSSKPLILQAVYSSVPVYEMLVRGIGVMRRRSDSWINATQLLKVAGITKSQRTKILDKDIAAPDSGIQFEKVQGGYGRYQGTWIPFHEAEKMAEQYGILELIRPLLDYQAAPPQAPLAGLPQQSPQATPSGPLEPLKPSQPNANARINGPSASAGLEQATGRKRPRPSLAEANGQPQSYLSEASTGAPSEAISASGSSSKRQKTDPAASSGRRESGTVSAYALAAAAVPRRLHRASKYPDTMPVNQEHRAALMSLFMTAEPGASTSSGGPEDTTLAEPDAQAIIAAFPADLSVDTPIDEQGHTALHWSSALARLSTVQALLAQGADVNRGNATGETALMRAVLVTNNFDSETFAPSSGPQGLAGLLGLLGASLRTLDDTGRSVLHHVALVAGIKGRSAAARHYMEAILHLLLEADALAASSSEEKDDLVNVRDNHGDTALNIAARVGSRPIVRMLLDSGADASIPNKLGLRAGDFGFLEDGLRATTAEEAAVDQVRGLAAGTSAEQPDSSSGGAPIPAEQRVSGAVSAISALFATLAADFTAEVSARSESLQRTRGQLHAATRDVAEQRAGLAALRSRSRQVELSKWRIRNLEAALAEEEGFDWTGRSGLDGEPAFDPATAVAAAAGQEGDDAVVRAAFEYRGPESVLKHLPGVDMPAHIDADAPLPASAAAFTGSPVKQSSSSPPPSQLTLLQLRRMAIWYERAISLLQSRIAAAREAEGEFEVEARRLVKVCTGLTADTSDQEVDESIESLITALESDAPDGADLQRVSLFMAKVRTAEPAEAAPAP